MTLQTSFPGPSGVVDSLMLRKNLTVLFPRDGAGAVSPGLTWGTNVVSSTATMNVAVAPFSAVLYRSGPIMIANDGAVNVLLDPAPGANSRIDVIYVMQHESGYGGFADVDNLPVLTFAKGTAAASPTVPTIPVGALSLAEVTIPAGATATNSGGVVIKQTAKTTSIAPKLVGTTALRDAYWGSPATAVDRVALAAAGAFWFNTDKGWEEQYFAGTADAGSGRFSRTAAGWYPSLNVGRVPLRPPTVSVGSGTFVMDGGIVRFTTATVVNLDGIFTADFNRYEINIGINSASAAADVLVAARTAGVNDSGNIFAYAATSMTTAGAVSGLGSGAQAWLIAGRTATGAGEINITVRDATLARPTMFLTRSTDGDGISRTGGAIRFVNTAHDGLLFSIGGAPNMTGWVQVHGINDY